MKIEHVAIWVQDIEAMKEFYVSYFDGQSNENIVMNQKDSNHISLNLEVGRDWKLCAGKILKKRGNLI